MKNRIFTRLFPILLLVTLSLLPALALASDVPTCPQITWEAQRQLVSNWAQTGSLTPSQSDWITGSDSQGTGSCTTASGCTTGSSTCPNGTAGCTSTSTTCPGGTTACPTGSGTSGTGTGTTCPNGTAGCTSTSTTCPTGTTCTTGSGTTGTACPNGTTGCTSTSTTCPTGTTCPTDTAPTTPADDTSTQNDGHYTPGAPTAQEIALYNEINAERVARGLDALPLDTSLSQLARMKSEDMAENHYFAHESPTYGSAAEMLADAGYPFNGVGENIAHAGSVEKAHDLLMSSDGHRRNILGSQWTKVGIGIVNDSNGYPLVTELFAR